MERWYALYTKSYKEHQVSNFLESRGYETYLPTIPVRKNGHEKTVPFFSCYLFVRVNPSNDFSSVRWTPGLRRIVRFGDQPVVVDDDIVSFLRQRLVEIEELGYEAYPFKPGDRVVITCGPLRDLEGVFDDKLSSRDREDALALPLVVRSSRRDPQVIRFNSLCFDCSRVTCTQVVV